MIFGNPVRGTIGLKASDPDLWYRSQGFGCTGFVLEPPLGSCKHYHRGNDIARGPDGCGDDVLATQDGKVFWAGALNGGSKAICIRHADKQATGVSHLASIIVKNGQIVKKGQKIGTVGKTGKATGCHVHTAYKINFPTTGDVNDFYQDTVGTWADIWPLLEQNVRISINGASTNIRNTAGGVIFAQSKSDGLIHREADNASLGDYKTKRDWGGTVTGPSYVVAGKTGKTWEKMLLDGSWRYVATPLVTLKA